MTAQSTRETPRQLVSKCKFCNEELRSVFADLGHTPLSNSYLTEEQLLDYEVHYPLKAYVCSSCLLVQVPEHEKAENIFRDDYAYFSSFSKTWLEHAARYAEMAIARFGLTRDSFVLEVASNDGYLLKNFVAAGIEVLGVDPARECSEAAAKVGVRTDVSFFNDAYAQTLKRKADLVVANNVFAHAPNINSFAQGFKSALAPNGYLTIECPHLMRLIEGNQFDTIYHEHFFYFSLLSSERILVKHGLQVVDVEELSTHGGSLRLIVRHAEENHAISEKVAKLRELELSHNLDKLSTYESFQARISKVKHDLLHFLLKAKAEGKLVLGYGAPAKGNTLLNFSGVARDLVSFTVDLSPFKQGKNLPGNHIPVKSPEQLCAANPDFVLILPWNIKHEIIAQLSGLRERGTKFVVAVPELEIIA